MKTLIHQAIQSINHQIDYINNNDDHLDSYYDFIGDMFTYHETSIIEKLTNLIEDNDVIDLNKAMLIDNEFLKDITNDIATNDYYFKLDRDHDVYGYTYEYDLFNIEAGENEIQIFDNHKDDLKMSEWVKNYIERKTDTVINDDPNYAYYIGFSWVTCSLNWPECIELITDKYIDLLAEQSNYECYQFNAIDLIVDLGNLSF